MSCSLAGTPKGDGLYAVKPIAKDTYLFDYSGEVLSEKQYFERYPDGISDYCCVITNDYIIDGQDPGKSGRARYMNHSSKRPNVYRVMQRLGPNKAVHLYTAKDVEVGQELMWDYGSDYWLQRPYKQID